MGGPLPHVGEEVRWLHELPERVQSICTASATRGNQGRLESLRQLRLAGGLREAGQAPMAIVRE